jgi:hypothetical protein
MKLNRYQRPKKYPKFWPNRGGEIPARGRLGRICNQKGAFGGR